MHCGVRSSKGNNVTPSLSALGLVQDALKYSLYIIVCFPSGSAVKNPPAMWETWVQSLGWEDLLEEGKATHSSILCLENLMDRGAWQATVNRVAKSQT